MESYDFRNETIFQDKFRYEEWSFNNKSLSHRELFQLEITDPKGLCRLRSYEYESSRDRCFVLY